MDTTTESPHVDIQPSDYRDPIPSFLSERVKSIIKNANSILTSNPKGNYVITSLNDLPV